VSGQSRVGRLRPLGMALFALALVTEAQQGPSRPPPPIEQAAHGDIRDDNVYLDGQSSGRGLVKKFTTNLLLDQKEIWTSPFRIHRSSAKWWILAGLGTAALIAADHPVSQALPFSGSSTNFGNAASRAGEWYTVFPAAGVLFATGKAFHDEKLEETGMLGLEALADADIVTNVVKVVARRERPGARDHGGHFEEGGSSFPSGHATQAWALAAVVASEYGSHKWVPYASYGYAALIDVSRVLSQEHFTSDVFVGSAIGFFIGRYVVHTQRIHREHVHSGKSILFTPTVSPSFSPVAKTVTLAWSY
jgi:membrane-associated phospholipid phosphatase